MNKNVDVSIIMGSDSDLPIMKEAAKFLDDMGISYEMTILSVHRCPEAASNYAKSLKTRKVKVIIAGAGRCSSSSRSFCSTGSLPCYWCANKHSNFKWIRFFIFNSSNAIWYTCCNSCN